MTPKQKERLFVHLAYLEDTGTRDKKSPFQVMAAVIVKDRDFHLLEVRTGAIAAREVVPPERWNKFEEFHAWELYGGYGVFDGVHQDIRFNAIRLLLEGIKHVKASIVYGAVNNKLFNQKLYSSADPQDVCFKICMEGIEAVIAKIEPPELVLLIADDTGNKQIKRAFRQSFRNYRPHLTQPIFPVGSLWHLHDDMYFGDSKESVGIQTADLCAYFIGKHLKGTDPAAEYFYKIIENSIQYQKIEPEDSK